MFFIQTQNKLIFCCACKGFIKSFLNKLQDDESKCYGSSYVAICSCTYIMKDFVIATSYV